MSVEPKSFGLGLKPEGKGVTLKCQKCGWTWEYRGSKPFTSCANKECLTKVKTGFPNATKPQKAKVPSPSKVMTQAHANRITQGRTEGKEAGAGGGESTSTMPRTRLNEGSPVGPDSAAPISVLPEFIEMHPADWQPPPKKPDFLGQIFSLQSKLAVQRDKNIRLALQNAELTAETARAMNEARNMVDEATRDAKARESQCTERMNDVSKREAELEEMKTMLANMGKDLEGKEAELAETEGMLGEGAIALEKERGRIEAGLEASINDIGGFQHILKATYEETASNVIPLRLNTDISAEEYDFGERTRRMHKALKDSIEGVEPALATLRSRLDDIRNPPQAQAKSKDEPQGEPPKAEPAPVTKIRNPLFMEHASDDKGIKAPGGKRPKAGNTGAM